MLGSEGLGTGRQLGPEGVRVGLFCILLCCSCVKPSDMVLVLSFQPVVSASVQVRKM